MLTLALIAAVLGQTPQHRLFLQPNLGRDDLAFFEAFPANGAGTSGACSTTAPTGAKGEALTFTRGSTATCTKTATGGLATTGIANGDLVALSSNVARVEYNLSGVLGLRLEPSAATNLNLQSADLANAVYANVGAPTVTANTTVSPDGTTTMATIQDNSAAALEGRSQTITVAAGSAYTLSVYVKAGTLSSVTVSLDGTTATCTSLSATTSTRCIITDASASGVAIVAQVTGGTVVGDTGTFIAWGQQVELGSKATAYVPTGAGTATRVGEGVPTWPVTYVAGAASVAVSIYTNYTPTTGETTIAMTAASGNPDMLGRFSGANFGCYKNSPGTDLAAGMWVTGANRWACSTGRTSYLNGVTASAAAAPLAGGGATIGIGSTGGFGSAVSGIYTNFCFDPSAARCAL